jgi:hypothetical protein
LVIVVYSYCQQVFSVVVTTRLQKRKGYNEPLTGETRIPL